MNQARKILLGEPLVTAAMKRDLRFYAVRGIVAVARAGR